MAFVFKRLTSEIKSHLKINKNADIREYPIAVRLSIWDFDSAQICVVCICAQIFMKTVYKL